MEHKPQAWHQKVFTIPNMLSLVRIILVPIFVVLYHNGEELWATILLVLSGITDALDGYIARHFHQISDIGKMLDPIADKLTQGAVAVMLSLKFKQIAPLLILFLLKELMMMVGGAILIKKGKRPVAAEWWGKLATFVFYGVMIIIVALGGGAFNYKLEDRTITILVSIAAVFMIFSFINYVPVFFKLHSGNDKEDHEE